MVGPGRWLLARSQCLEHASRAGRERRAGRRGGGRESEVAGDWLSRVAGARSLRLLSALLQPRSGRRLRAPSGPIRSQPAPAGVAAIGRSLVTKRDKGRRGKEKKTRKKKKKWKKESANSGYWQAGRALGGSSCPETGGAPAEARSARTCRRGGGLAGARHCPETGRGGGERTERGACCHLAGRAVFWPLGCPRAEFFPHGPLPLAGTARPTSPTPMISCQIKQRSLKPVAEPFVIAQREDMPVGPVQQSRPLPELCLDFFPWAVRHLRRHFAVPLCFPQQDFWTQGKLATPEINSGAPQQAPQLECSSRGAGRGEALKLQRAWVSK